MFILFLALIFNVLSILCAFKIYSMFGKDNFIFKYSLISGIIGLICIQIKVLS